MNTRGVRADVTRWGASRSTPETRGSERYESASRMQEKQKDLKDATRRRRCVGSSMQRRTVGLCDGERCGCGGADRATKEEACKSEDGRNDAPAVGLTREKVKRKKGVAGKRRRRRWMTRVMAQRQGTSGGSVGRQRGRCTAHEHEAMARAHWIGTRCGWPLPRNSPNQHEATERTAPPAPPTGGVEPNYYLLLMDSAISRAGRQAVSQPASQAPWKKVGNAGCAFPPALVRLGVARQHVKVKEKKKKKKQLVHAAGPTRSLGDGPAPPAFA